MTPQKPNLGLTDDAIAACTKALSALLADEAVLYQKLRNYHWNMVGPLFVDLHKLFEEQYTELEAVIDEMAERITSLGQRAPGSFTEFLEHTRLTESTDFPKRRPEDMSVMLENILADHESIIQALRADVDTAADHRDHATADMLTKILGQHEKMAWMLRSIEHV